MEPVAQESQLVSTARAITAARFHLLTTELERSVNRFLIAMFALVGIFSFSFPCMAEQPKQDPKAVLEAFCKASYEGDEDQWHRLVEFSPMRQKKVQSELRKQDPSSHLSASDMILNVAFSSDPIVVVRSYRILGISVKGDTATAEVEYEVVGEFTKAEHTQVADRFTVENAKTQKETVKIKWSKGKKPMRSKRPFQGQ